MLLASCSCCHWPPPKLFPRWIHVGDDASPQSFPVKTATGHVSFPKRSRFPFSCTDLARFLSHSSSNIPLRRHDSLHSPNLHRRPSLRSYRPPDTFHRELSKAHFRRHPCQRQRPGCSRQHFVGYFGLSELHCGRYSRSATHHIRQSQRHYHNVPWHCHQRRWATGDFHSACPRRGRRDNLREPDYKDRRHRVADPGGYAPLADITCRILDLNVSFWCCDATTRFGGHNLGTQCWRHHADNGRTCGNSRSNWCRVWGCWRRWNGARGERGNKARRKELAGIDGGAAGRRHVVLIPPLFCMAHGRAGVGYRYLSER